MENRHSDLLIFTDRLTVPITVHLPDYQCYIHENKSCVIWL